MYVAVTILYHLVTFCKYEESCGMNEIKAPRAV